MWFNGQQIGFAIVKIVCINQLALSSRSSSCLFDVSKEIILVTGASTTVDAGFLLT
jgi:hypothetical protein